MYEDWFLYTLANTYYCPPVLSLPFYYVLAKNLRWASCVSTHFAGFAKNENPNHSLCGPFLRAVFVASNVEGWSNISYWKKKKPAYYKSTIFIHQAQCFLAAVQTYYMQGIHLGHPA